VNQSGKLRRLRLINPTSPLSTISMPAIIQKMTFSRRALFMPLNLAICAAVAGEGWEPEIVDENVLDAPHMPTADVDAVGIGAMTTQARRAYQLADAYRALGVKVIMGGIHASALPDEALRHADIVCLGDAESTLPAALADLAAGKAKPLYDWRDRPDTPIAAPRKDLLDPRDYLVFNPIQTTRGCPHNCTFCSTPAIFGRRFRQRAISDIVDEMRESKERYGSKMFIFSDDNVAGNHGWAMELFEAIRPLGVRWASQCDILIARDEKLLDAMRSSGCIGVILGLESPDAGTLAAANKQYVDGGHYMEQIAKIQSKGISIWGSFIFGFDGDTWKSCMGSVRFGQRAGLSMSIYSILTPFPGTAVFDQYQREGRLLTTDWEKYNGATVVYQPRGMSVDELRHAQMAAFREFYALPSALRRLRLLPLKSKSWMANLAINRGLRYYYGRNGRPLPAFADFAAADAKWRIDRSLGITRRVRMEL
jgi:radical SAM superfamily enzyme YgiQ (UPF0313 family)